MAMDMAEYRGLLEKFPPTPIHSRKQLQATETVIDGLLALQVRTAAQDAYLELLSIAVSAWEDENVEVPRLSARELLKVLIEERGIRQKDLAAVFGSESIVSEVLSGKRQLNLHYITGLAEYFHISPAVFMLGTTDITAPDREPAPV
jgi:HTH-type transcriptional regulator / antitoxin HigA